jgi:hypothetical protein
MANKVVHIVGGWGIVKDGVGLLAHGNAPLHYKCIEVHEGADH